MDLKENPNDDDPFATCPVTESWDTQQRSSLISDAPSPSTIFNSPENTQD